MQIIELAYLLGVEFKSWQFKLALNKKIVI
jgi:hypothetical protein